MPVHGRNAGDTGAELMSRCIDNLDSTINLGCFSQLKLEFKPVSNCAI